jgi:hypothetical protein
MDGSGRRGMFNGWVSGGHAVVNGVEGLSEDRH